MGYDNYPPGVTDSDPYFNPPEGASESEILEVMEMIEIEEWIEQAVEILKESSSVESDFYTEIEAARITIKAVIDELDHVRIV